MRFEKLHFHMLSLLCKFIATWLRLLFAMGRINERKHNEFTGIYCLRNAGYIMVFSVQLN